MKNNILILALVALVIGVGSYFYFFNGVEKKGVKQQPHQPVDTNPLPEEMPTGNVEKAQEEGLVEEIKNTSNSTKPEEIEKDLNVENLDEDLNLDDLDQQIDDLNL